VTQNEHHRNTRAKFARHRLDIFDSTRSRIFSGGICVSFALQSRFAPSRRKWRAQADAIRAATFHSRTQSQDCALPDADIPGNIHAQTPRNCPKAKRTQRQRGDNA